MGKTINQVEDAITRARIGRVIVIAYADEVSLAKAILVCRDALRQTAYNWRPSTLSYELLGGGCVRFVAIKRDADGRLIRPKLDDYVPKLLRNMADLEFDHYATYLLDREKRRLEERAAL